MSTPQSERIGDQLRVMLPPDLNTDAAVSLREMLLEEVESGITVRLEAGAIERLSTTAAQTLVAAEDFITRMGAQMVLAAPTPVLVEGLSDLGLFPRLMDWNLA